MKKLSIRCSYSLLSWLAFLLAFTFSHHLFAQEACVCNWYGNDTRPLCENQDTGWGWENNATCIGRQTCEDQGEFSSGGVECNGSSSTSSSSSNSSTTSSSTSTSTSSSTSSSSSSSGGGSNNITVRMQGIVGDESVSLLVSGTTLKTWTLSTSMQDYSLETDASGDLRVAFTNDGGSRDVRVDYVIVNGVVYQAEDQEDNTGAWDGSCGAGSYSEMLHCNGSIGFGNPFDGSSSSSSSSSTSSTTSSNSSSGGNPNFPGKFVGNITTSGKVRSDFTLYWNQITPENEGKWGSVEGSRDSYNWSGLDAAYNFAKSNGIPFKQHTFVWGSQYPSWINNLSASEQAAEIEEWIRDYCNRYPDTDMIDVVNESTPGHAPAEFARNAFGSDWILDSFRLARKYCPNAVLILNDYNVLRWNTNQFIEMARPAIDAGLVDAIGVQAHGLESQSISELKSNLDKIANLGLPIYVAEYDINKTNDQEQLSIMREQFPVFYNHPKVVGITLWGYVLGSTWREGTGLIKSDGTPRPAMTWLMDYLNR